MPEIASSKTFPAKLLSDVLSRARKTEFYRDRFSNIQNPNPELWGTLPLTTKEDLRNSYPFGLMGVPREEIATYHESSGTSGKPIASYFTDGDWNDIQTRFLRSRVKIGPGDLVFVKTPYSLVTTALQMHGAARLAGATVIPGDNRSGNMPYSRVIRLLHELPVTVVWCLPTEALIWAYLIRKQGLNPATDFPKLRALVVAGEVLSPGKKTALSRIWGGKEIIEDYGSTETGSLAGECTHGKLHVWGDRIHCETVNGSLVVTPLYREAMPLVRYDMEDRVLLSKGCECGSEHARIEILGRQSQRIAVSPSEVYPKDIEDVVYSSPGEVWFWRARAKKSTLEVEICGDGIDEKQIENEFQSRLGISSQVTKVAAELFVDKTWLAQESAMQKPRFIFSENENWDQSLAYF